MFACSQAVAGALQCPDKLTPKNCENLILCKKQQQPLLMSNFHVSQMWKKKKKIKKGVEWNGELGENNHQFFIITKCIFKCQVLSLDFE
jgi:hypothetical protein